MRGHESVLEVRKQGYAVDNVWVQVLDFDKPKYPFMQDPDNALELGLRPEIYINRCDKIPTLDFRCLVGATVHLIGEDETRVRSILKQILRYKPARVIASGFDGFIDTGSEHESAAA